MAEVFPSAILDSVLKQLKSHIFQRDSKVNCGLRTQLRDLQSKLELIRAVIYDAELMDILFPKFFRKWMCELQRVLYEVDDLLDEALTRSMPESDMLAKVRLRLYNLPFQYLKLANKIKNLNERLEGIVNECYKCNLLVKHGGGTEKPFARQGILRNDPDYAKDNGFHMIGRDEDKKKVIKILLDEEVMESPIVWVSGPAGAGTTTLCRAVYNDEEVSNRFELRLWVDLRGVKDLSSIELLKKIIRMLHGGNRALPNLEAYEAGQLRSRLTRFIGNRKALLVLDGLPPHGDSSGNMTTWSKVQKLIYVTSRVCRVLVPCTQELTDLYSILEPVISTNNSHKLKNDLSEEHSWSIFKNTALVATGHDSEEWVEDLGRQIVSRCLGNPALLRGVGTLLCGKVSKDDKATWEYFAFEFDFHGQYDRYLTMSALYRIFERFHQSVGYLSLFSVGGVKYEALLNQFVANGFTKFEWLFKEIYLRPIEEIQDWDDADRYKIDEAAGKEIKLLAEADSIVMVWRDENLPRWKLSDLTQAARHVSIVRPRSERQLEENIVLPYSLIEDVIRMRSLLFLGKWCPIRMSVQTLDVLASNLRYLRVLDLQDLALKELPSSISKLIHLRYLDVSRNNFKELPGSICRLKNLLMLRLVYCDKLIRLPERIKNIHLLVHLEIDMCLDLTHMPSSIANLMCLRRLDRFVVCPRKGGLRYLEHLDNLSGLLAIEFPRRWENSREDAEKANLERKKGLTALEFKCQGTDKGDEDNDNDIVLEKLKPPASIENLFIGNFVGTTFPSWITPPEMGTCLTRITISYCKKCRILPHFHGFPKLKYLTLTSMMNIEYPQENNNGSDVLCAVSWTPTVFFPSLSELRIGNMPRLNGWSRDSSGSLEIQRMGIVEIWKCPGLTIMPTFSMLFSPVDRSQVILQDVPIKMLQWFDWGSRHDAKLITIQDMVALPINIVTCFPEKLEVKDCNRLKIFWTDEVCQTETWKSGVEGLCNLSIVNCRALKLLSHGLSFMFYLRQLEISRCSEELDCLYDKERMACLGKPSKISVI